jgi:hypothetical protein
MHISLELGLLILESVLLVATIVLLVLSLKEGRGRDRLIMEVERATRVLSRHEYFITVTDTLMDAEVEVIGSITGRFPVGDDSKRTKEVAYTIEKLSQSGVRIRYLLPRFHDRLHVGWLYRRAGADVRFGSDPHLHDFRYVVADGKVAVLGIPEETGAQEATKRGFRIPSRGLSSLLKEDFEKSWESATHFSAQVKETLSHTGMTPETLAREFQIDVDDLSAHTG